MFGSSLSSLSGTSAGAYEIGEMSWKRRLLLFSYKHRKALLYLNALFLPMLCGAVLMEFTLPNENHDKPVSVEQSVWVRKMLDDADKRTTRQKLEHAAFAMHQIVNPTIAPGRLAEAEEEKFDNKGKGSNG